ATHILCIHHPTHTQLAPFPPGNGVFFPARTARRARASRRECMRLDGKVALVTGAASGIGKRIREVDAESGASVAIADLNLDGANATAQEIAKKGVKAIGVKMDVTNEQEVDD